MNAKNLMRGMKKSVTIMFDTKFNKAIGESKRKGHFSPFRKGTTNDLLSPSKKISKNHLAVK